VTVVAVTDELVTVDGNHPLAGKNLNFDVTIEAVREASEEEIARGHLHNLDAEEQ
jgi:FKBP-type peptidyl-prolyl cis-trans isomerase SlyD